MEKNDVIAIVAAILATRDTSVTIPGAVEEAKRLWKIVDTGEVPKSNPTGNISSI